MTNSEQRNANGQRIVEIASKYIGIKEKGNNAGFTNAELEKDMLDIGWQRGWAYCILWTKLVWLKAYQEDIQHYQSIETTITPSVSLTLTKLKRLLLVDNDWSYGKECIPGSIGLLQWGAGKGHAFIVESVDDDGTITTLEANTNSGGSSEGDGIYRRHRKITDSGLKGFIHPF